MNVLLTSVGRRSYMVKYFKELLGEEGQVHVSNSDDLSVALQYADHKVITPLIYDDDYIPFLLNYCREHKIDIVLSLFDIDLLVLAKNKERFTQIGTNVIVSDVSVIEICNDKWKTYQFLSEHGFHTPKTYPSVPAVTSALEQGEIAYPIIVKPRFGCGSISLSVAHDEEELLYLYKKGTREVNQSYLKYESAVTSEKLIFQECLKGQEYGADIINDLNGELRQVNVRKKLAMRSGETDIAELVNEPAISMELERLGKSLRHIANMDCDVFLADGIPYILELNARFGGGYPFCHTGGCNLPQAILTWSCGHEINDQLLCCNTGMRIYKELVLTSDSD